MGKRKMIVLLDPVNFFLLSLIQFPYLLHMIFVYSCFIVVSTVFGGWSKGTTYLLFTVTKTL